MDVAAVVQRVKGMGEMGMGWDGDEDAEGIGWGC